MMIEIDMKMPACCDECFALDDHGDYPYCLISQDQRGYTFNTRENRMPSCPLKDNEPRVLTLEEVESSDGSVWLERNMPEWETPIAVLVDKVGKYLDTFIAIGGLCFQGEKSQGQEYGDYGKTWRCWSSRPTDEQREATPWNT